MKIISSEGDDDMDSTIKKLAKKIIDECAEAKRDTSIFDKRICLDDALNCCSPTLLELLANISSKLDNALPASMAGNIVTSCVTSKPTSLQIALGITTHGKSFIETLHSFGVTSNYDEVMRFKASAAHAASKDMEQLGISAAEDGLIQAVADNFDAQISSPNGLQSTHALAILLTQPQKQKKIDDERQMKRLKKAEMSQELPDLPIIQYEGPKKPAMPDHAARCSPLPLKILAHQVISLKRAKDTDFQFMKDIVTVQNTPEFGGYNTKLSRLQSHSVRPKTRSVYLPLVDMAPAEPSTMLTAMVEAQKLTNAAGQQYTIFTNDQQLYRVPIRHRWIQLITDGRLM